MRQGKFTDLTKQSGIKMESSKALAVADFDNDGHSDFIVSSLTNGISLYRGKGNGSFEISILKSFRFTSALERIDKTSSELFCHSLIAPNIS